MTPKAILQFDLPEEREEYDMHVNGGKMYCALFDLYNHLRQMWKYGEDEQKAQWAEELWDFVRDHLDTVEIP